MGTVPHEVARCLGPRDRDGSEFKGEVGEANGLLAVVVWVRVEDGGGVAAAEEVDVRVDAAGEGLRQPVQHDRVEDVLLAGRRVRPLDVLFADPAQQRERAGRQRQPDRPALGAVFLGVRVARRAELDQALQVLRLLGRHVGGVDALRLRGHEAEVQVDGLARLVPHGHDAREEAADVAAVRDVPAAAEAQPDHELVHHVRHVFVVPFLLDGRPVLFSQSLSRTSHNSRLRVRAAPDASLEGTSTYPPEKV